MPTRVVADALADWRAFIADRTSLRAPGARAALAVNAVDNVQLPNEAVNESTRTKPLNILEFMEMTRPQEQQRTPPPECLSGCQERAKNQRKLAVHARRVLAPVNRCVPASGNANGGKCTTPERREKELVDALQAVRLDEWADEMASQMHAETVGPHACRKDPCGSCGRPKRVGRSSSRTRSAAPGKQEWREALVAARLGETCGSSVAAQLLECAEPN
jgi:hypothetical protein